MATKHGGSRHKTQINLLSRKCPKHDVFYQFKSDFLPKGTLEEHDMDIVVCKQCVLEDRKKIRKYLKNYKGRTPRTPV